jgi:site-specific recombinase XerD
MKGQVAYATLDDQKRVLKFFENFIGGSVLLSKVKPRHAEAFIAHRLSIQVVQQLAGHSDISTTRKYYLAVRSEDLASANKFLNSIFAKVKTD